MSPLINNFANIVTRMTKPDAIEPIIALEATVTGGRTKQAYNRGGQNEARERLIEETTGAVVWIAGVKVLNDYVGDPILKKLFGANFDVGTDKVLRTPFKNYLKKNPNSKFSAKQIAGIKAFKVLASVLLADAFIGLVVPPLNQKLTRNMAKKKAENKQQVASKEQKNVVKTQPAEKPTFKGMGVNAINTFTNIIENTNTGKLLSTDAGLISGRMYSARNNEERREIAIRDIGSIYFYMWAQNHVGNLLNFIETGRFTRLNPATANLLDEHIANFLKSKGGSMSVEEFKNSILGKASSEIKLPENINFETAELSKFSKFMNNFTKSKAEPLQVAKVSDLEKIITDKNVMDRIREMAKLQPKRQGEFVITKQQIIDSYNVAKINDPKFLDKVFVDFTKGASKDELKFVSNTKLYNLKAEMEDYVRDICKKTKNGKVDESLLKSAKNKNLVFSGINFAAGFAVAALFLSTLIPKFQYWYTKHTTGKDAFPGTYDLEEKTIAKA